jgi:tetratricopeptide (TPR) repeat protein
MQILSKTCIVCGIILILLLVCVPATAVNQTAVDYFREGNDFYGLRRYDDALRSYDKAIEIDPNFADAWYYRGLALSKLDRYNEAIASYEMAIRIDPNWTERQESDPALQGREKMIPLIYAPIGAITLMGVLSVWRRQ